MLVLSRKADETILIGDDIEVMITNIKGNRVIVGINAPADVKVIRKEIADDSAKPARTAD